MGDYKGSNPLMVSLVKSEASESHVVGTVQKSDMRLVMDSVEKSSSKLTKEFLTWCDGGTGVIGGVAQVFEVTSVLGKPKGLVPLLRMVPSLPSLQGVVPVVVALVE